MSPSALETRARDARRGSGVATTTTRAASGLQQGGVATASNSQTLP